jgi:hypothetical protein
LVSTAKKGKTKLKENSLLYVVRSGGLSVPVSDVICEKFNGQIAVMPAKVLITRYGNETKRRAEVKPTIFVFPMVDCGEQDKGKCLRNILSSLKDYKRHIENLWSYNKHGCSATNLDYIVGYPTLEETAPPDTIDELSGWLYVIVNNLLHYYHNILISTVESKFRILNDVDNALPGLKFKIRRDDVGVYHCQHLQDIRDIVSDASNKKGKIASIIKWALSQKALMTRRLFYHNAKVYGSAYEISRDLHTAMVVPKPIMLNSVGWENLFLRGSLSYRKLKYTWMTSTNNLPINYKGDTYNNLMPWVDYFKAASKGRI